MKPGLLLVTTSFPGGTQGSEAAGAFVRDIALALARYCRVTVVAPGGAGEGEEHDSAMDVRRYYAPVQPLSLLRPENPTHWLPIVQTLNAGYRAVYRSLEQEAIDHVLALWALPSGYWAMRAGRRHGRPYSVWALGSDIWSLGRMPGLRSLLGLVLAGAENRFADGYRLGDDVSRIGGRPCQFLPSSRRLEGSSPARKRAASPPYRLAYLGRWHPNKGTDLLLEALALLGDEDWQRIAEVRIAGGGPQEPLVLDAVAKLRAADRPVTSLGFQSKAEAAALLDWADYLIIPSRLESIPVVFSDALQQRCPIIATPAGDLPRLYRKRCFGVLAEGISAEAIAKAIRAALRIEAFGFQHSLGTLCAEFDVEAIAVRLFDTLFRKGR